MAEALRPRDVRFILICLLICAISLFIGSRYFYRAFPEASIDFRVDRHTSQPAAENFLAKQGINLSGYLHASTFRYDDESKVFLERELGLGKANALMGNQVKLWRWGHRWFKQLQKEEFQVEITTRGELASFFHAIPENSPGADLPAAAARSLAESFLVLEMKRPVDSLEFVDIHTEKQPRRTDHVLTWRESGIDLKQGSYRINVTIQGDKVGGYSEFVKIPEEWSRGYARLRSLNESASQFDLIIMALLGVAMLVVLGNRMRLKDVRWRTAFSFALICFVLQFLSSLNELPLAEYGFDTTGTYGSFLSRSFMAAALEALIYAGLIMLLTASAEAVYRQSYPAHPSIPRMFSWQAIRTRKFFIGSLVGITLTFVFFAYEIGFYLLANKLGAWAPADVPYTDLLSTKFPWIFVLLGGFFPAISEEWMFRAFSIPFLQRLLRHRWIAVLLASLIWGFGHSNYPNQPFFIRGIEVGIVGLVLSWAMIRFGILAPLIAHYSIDAFYSAFLLLRSGNPYLVTSGAITAGINLLPLLVACFAYLFTRKFHGDSSVSNEIERAAPDMLPTAGPGTEISMPAYQPLSRARTISALLLLVVGIVSIFCRAPRFGGLAQFRISASQAVQSAKSYLSKLGFDLSGYRSSAQPQDRVDDLASQYIYSQKGIQGLNSIYGSQITPLAWQARFYKPLQKEEYQVSIEPGDGRAVAFHHSLLEDDPGTVITDGEAQQMAISFVKSQGFNLDKFQLKEIQSEKRKQRQDMEFTWEAVPGTPGAIGEARLDLKTGVFGGKIGNWTQSIRIPEEWKRARESKNFYSTALLGIRAAFAAVMLFLVVRILVKGTRQSLVRWRIAGKIAALAMFLELLDSINSIPLFAFQYDTQIDMPIYIITCLAQGFLVLIGIGLAAMLAAAVIMACYPDVPAVLGKGGLRLWGRDAAISVAATLGLYLTLQWLVSRMQYHAYRLMLAPALSTPENVGRYFPFISDFHDIILSVLFFSAVITFSISLWDRLARRPWWRIVLLACLLACFLPSSAKQPSEAIVEAIPSVLMVAIACVLVIVFARNNYLAYLLCAAFFSLARISLLSPGHGNLSLEIQRGLLWALMLAVLAFLAFRKLRSAPGDA